MPTETATSDTLRLAFLDGITTPDPDTAYESSELNLVNSAYEGLLSYQPGIDEPELIGVLATDWSANDDNTQFTFTLREGVTFHDGTPFDASAVKASFDRRNTLGEGPSYMTAGVASVDEISDHEIVITLDSPNSSFLDLLASPFGPKMISPAAIAEHPAEGDVDWFDTNDAGTGPYTYGDFQVGSSYELVEYDDYWGDAPGYPRVTFDVLSDMSTVQLELQSGDLDGIIGYTDAPTFAAFQQDDALTTYRFPSMQTPTMFINPASAELGDEGTRVALVSGIDFAALTAAALGSTAEPTDQVFPVNLLDASLNEQVVPYDADTLSELSTGALSGTTISIAYAENSPAGRALSDNLAAILNGAGINAESIAYGSGTYYSALEAGADAPDITFFTGFPDTAHPDAWAYVFYTPQGGLDLFGAEVDGVSDLLDAALANGDPELYGEVAQLVSASGYWRSVATMLGTAVFQKTVAGVEDSNTPVITSVLDLSKLHPAA